MYLVKASSAVSFPEKLDGPNVEWSADQVRLVDDSIIERIRAHSVFTIVAGPDFAAIVQAARDESGYDTAGAKNGSTVTASEASPKLHTTTLTLTATPITVADDAGVAQYGGTGKIYDFPAGLIQIYGAVVTGTITMGATGTFIDAWTGVVSLGTAAAGTGATLTSTEADIMASNAISAATSKVGTVDAVSTNAASPILDGTATAKDLYLNLAIADDATHTAGTGTFTGTVVITWANLGDN